jgi:cytoskeleton protein RodZ
VESGWKAGFLIQLSFMSEKTIGQQLKAAREKKHLSLDDIADALHIRSSYLQILEENQLDQLPSQTQARGFIRLYASYVGLNPLEILKSQELTPQPFAEKEVVSEESNKSVTQPENIPKIEKKPHNLREIPATPIPSVPSVQTGSSPYETILKEIGENLISRRKKLALSLEEVEKHTHIRRAYLDAIERGKIEDLPSTIQGRGLLSNYAEFLDLDPDPILIRFAEALQSKVNTEQSVLSETTSNQIKSHHPVWIIIKKYITLDLLVGGALILILFFFVFWGAAQVINSNIPKNSESILGTSVSSGGTIHEGTIDSSTGLTTGAINPIPSFVSTDSAFIQPSPSLAATPNKYGAGSLQVNVIASQSAFVRVIADGRQIYDDRVIGGNAYQFSGTSVIELITGNAAALRIIFNGTQLSSLGSMGQVVDILFTSTGIQTATPVLAASPTSTSSKTPTLSSTPTQQPASTSTNPNSLP